MNHYKQHGPSNTIDDDRSNRVSNSFTRPPPMVWIRLIAFSNIVAAISVRISIRISLRLFPETKKAFNLRFHLQRRFIPIGLCRTNQPPCEKQMRLMLKYQKFDAYRLLSFFLIILFLSLGSIHLLVIPSHLVHWLGSLSPPCMVLTRQQAKAPFTQQRSMTTSTEEQHKARSHVVNSALISTTPNKASIFQSQINTIASFTGTPPQDTERWITHASNILQVQGFTDGNELKSLLSGFLDCETLDWFQEHKALFPD